MYTFITNPNARSGLGQKLWNEIESILTERNVNYQVLFTRYQHHATSLVRELTSDLERHTIVVIGGDGTINEVINGIVRLDKVTLGYIPMGSGNDFARGLALPTDIRQALDNILTPSRYISMDIGLLSYEEEKRRFAVSAGIGFDADVCHQVVISPLKAFFNRLKLGKLTYTGVALHRLLAMETATLTLTLDDGRQVRYPHTYFAAAMNLRFEGGGFMFCPKADYKDGLLDIIVISDLPKLKVLALLPTAFRGWHVRFKGIHITSCRSVDITSERALPLHTDGEPVFRQTHINLCLEPDRLRIIAAP